MSSVKIENVEMQLVFPDNNIIKLPSSLVNKAFGFFLTEIKGGDEVLVEFDKPKQMVPSFEKAKSDSILILQYSNAEPDVPATIALKLELDIVKGEVKMSGHGFTNATLSVESEEFPTAEEIKAAFTKDNKVLNIDLSDVPADKVAETVAAIRDEHFAGEDLGK